MAIFFRVLIASLAFHALARGADSGSLTAVPFSALSDQHISLIGRKALSLHPDNWKQGETEHFVLHFIQKYVADAVASESEFYFAYITSDLGVDAASVPGKCHIYIFEDRDDWAEFIHTAQLEAWTGAVTMGSELFVPRDPGAKYKGHALGHEVVHLLVHRYVGIRLPLWLEEGYAEDTSMSAYGAYYRCRGALGRMPKNPLTSFCPLARLTALTAYPPTAEVETFYTESNWLTGFLREPPNQQNFLAMLKSMAKGELFESALRDVYKAKWSSISELEADFRSYCEKPK